jgi:peptide/nickel transport system permease protein
VAEGLVKGTPWDLLLFAGIVLPSAIIGLTVGVISGGSRGALDDALMTITDAVLSIPTFVIALLVYVVVFPSLPHWEIPLVFALSMVLISWAPYARIVRAKARMVANESFVEASIAAGAGGGRVLFRHMMPNSSVPILSQIPITLSNLIALMTIIPFVAVYTSRTQLTTVFVTFFPSLNFPDWTWLLANGMLGWSPNAQTNAWWGYTFPTVWIFAFVLGCFLFCDGLQDFLSVHQDS